jgi:hypothetical protein
MIKTTSSDVTATTLTEGVLCSVIIVGTPKSTRSGWECSLVTWTAMSRYSCLRF